MSILLEVLREQIYLLWVLQQFLGLSHVIVHFLDWTSSDNFYFVGLSDRSVQIIRFDPGRIIVQHSLELSFKYFVVDVWLKVLLSVNEVDIAFVEFNHFVMQVTQEASRLVLTILQIGDKTKKDPRLQQ